MTRHYGLDVVQAYMRHVQDNAEAAVRARIGVLDGRRVRIRDGQRRRRSASAIRIDRERRRTATIDFTGTSPQQPNNFNAPLPVTRAAVLYVFRTLVDDEIPMNAGCMKPIELIVPEGSMLNPRYPAAVVAGNVETSQVVTDCLYGALGVLAASQGTMNNFTFGNDAPVLRNDRGGVGRGAGLRRHGRGADAHDELAAHGSRGAGVPVSGAARELPRPSRLGRRRAASRRRRRRATAAIPRADDRGDARQSPARRAVRTRGRPSGRDGRQLDRAARRARQEPFGATFSSAVDSGDAIVVRTPGGGGFGKP